MRKVILAVLLIAAIALVSCQKKNKTITITTPEGKQVTTVTSPTGKVMSVTAK